MSRRGSSDGEDRFRIRPGKPKQRGDVFVSQVLRQAAKAANATGGKRGKTPGSRLGRGHVAARFTGQSLFASSRRATVKVRLVYLKQAGARSTIAHLRYIEREGVGREQDTGKAYGPMTDEAATAAFEERGREDRHQFRLIVSPEDAEQLDDLRTYTRHLMGRMEADLGTRLDWVAVNHWNTDNPHTHVVLRGKDDTGKDLIISQAYITRSMRERAAELSTEWLGPRTELEIQRTLVREVDQERWTSLDRTLQREARDGLNHVDQPAGDPKLRQQRVLLVGRLQRLQRMGLATQERPGIWAVHADAEPVLRAMGERGDIIRTMQRAMGNQQRELAVFQEREDGHSIIGRVAAKGLADELYDKGYLVIDGIDGKAHYVALPAKTELEPFPVGAVVEARGLANIRAADKNIAALTADGLYRTDHHLAIAKAQAIPEREPREVVDTHVRRLEALRRAGIVERMAEGVWKVPADLPEQGRLYDAQRLGGVAVKLHSHLPIGRQTHAIGSTWLDQQLISGGKGLGELGFGREVREALRQRSDFLIDQELAERRGQRVILARNLLATLRSRELATAAQSISTETGLEHRPVADGERVSGVYRRSVVLASGRFAMLDDRLGFWLIPWNPVIERRLGQHLSAIVHGSSVSWQLGRQRGLSIE
jgi:type IV secretory pathway VirD2 relaxase